MIKRIGFACKWIDTIDQIDGIKSSDPARALSTQTTTLAWVNRQSKSVAYDRLWQIMQHNITSIQQLVSRVGSLAPQLRMVRLSSEILPLYTHKDWTQFYQQSDVQQYMISQFAKVGDIARQHDVRLSFHPGQFTVLASHRPDVVDNSIAEFEYHADMASMMGYGRTFQDFKINVHISGKLGPDGIISALPRLSNVARNCITIENEENTYGLDKCLQLAAHVPIVLDLHHHWVHDGFYLRLDDSRINTILNSWRGVRPVLHYSQSREDLLCNHSINTKPHYSALIKEGYSKPKLRAHSNFYWNVAVNAYALEFLEHFDIMCESKAKNLASQQLYAQYLKQCNTSNKEVECFV